MSRSVQCVGLLLLATSVTGCTTNRSSTWRTSHQTVRPSAPVYSPAVQPSNTAPADPGPTAPAEPTPAEAPAPTAAFDDVVAPSPFEQLMPEDPSPLLPSDVDTTSARTIQASPWSPRRRAPVESDDFQPQGEEETAGEEPASAVEELGEGAIASILGRQGGRRRMDRAFEQSANEIARVSYDLRAPGHSTKPR